MDRLPTELFYSIVDYLVPDIDSLVALGQVSSRLRAVSSDNRFWRQSLSELYHQQLHLTEDEISAIQCHRDVFFKQMRLFHEMPSMIDRAVASRGERLNALMDICEHGPLSVMPLQEVVMKGKGLFSHQYYAVHCLDALQNCRSMSQLEKISSNPQSHTVLDLLTAFHNFNTLRKGKTLELPDLFSVPLGLLVLQRDGMDPTLPTPQRAWLLASHFSLPQSESCRTKVDLMADTSLRSLSDISLLGLYAWYGKEYCNLNVSLVVLPFQCFARIENDDEESSCFFLDVTAPAGSPFITKETLLQRCIDNGMPSPISEEAVLQPSSVHTVANSLVRDAIVNARTTTVPKLVSNAQKRSSTNVPKLADSFLRLMTVKVLFGGDSNADEVKDAAWCAGYIISNLWYQRPRLLDMVHSLTPDYAKPLMWEHFGVLKTKLVPEYKDLGDANNDNTLTEQEDFKVGSTVTHNPTQCSCIIVHRSQSYYVLYSEIDGLVSSSVADISPSSHMVALGYDKVGEYFSGYDCSKNVYIPGVDLAKFYPNDYTNTDSTQQAFLLDTQQSANTTVTV